MDLAKHWRQRAARYRLEGQRHRESGAIRFPPAQVGGQATEGWEDAVQFAMEARAADAPGEQQFAQGLAHWHLAGAGLGLGHVGQGTIALLNAADADDVGFEVDILPQQP